MKRLTGLLLGVILAISVAPAQQVEPPSDRFYPGRLLVAAPALSDSGFRETVILMVRHDEDGAFGLIVNRVIGESSMSELMAGFDLEAADPDERVAFHYGGPVERRSVFVLHGPDYKVEGTQVITPSVRMTPTMDVMRDIAAGEGPEQKVIAFGYAGWAPNQLEFEMLRQSWIVIHSDPALVFAENPDETWNIAIERQGTSL